MPRPSPPTVHFSLLASFLGPLALFALAACSTPSGLVTAPVGPSPAAVGEAPVIPSVPRWRVWTHGAEESAETTWLVDATGAVRGSEPGASIVARGAAWRWTTEDESVVTQACPEYDANGQPLPATGPAPEPGHVTRAVLKRADANETMTVVDPPPDADGVADLQHGVRLVATVGPYLFLHQSTYVYACGAHGNVGCDATVFDAERGAVVWSDAEHATAGLVDRAEWDGARRRAIDHMSEVDEVTSFATDGKVELDLTELVPSYSPDATLGLALQFTAGTCYACSDGAWSSYSASTQEPAALPGNLAGFRVAPAGVRAFARQHPEVTIGGWSEGA